MHKLLAQPNPARMRILVVDDDLSVLRIIAAMLRHWGYEVVLAHDGQEAWEILQKEDIRLVISDWMMPGLNGPELCQRVREAGFPGYIYLILLTGREDKLSLVEGMDAGADDFMVKPVHREELRVRVRAGGRILRLEAELGERNHRLNAINQTLSEAYATIRHDLESAATMQKALLPPPLRLPGVAVEWLFQPSSFIAGDIFDYFMIDERRLNFYQLDVAGHGVPAALLSFTLNQVLAQGAKEKTLARSGRRTGGRDRSDPGGERIEPALSVGHRPFALFHPDLRQSGFADWPGDVDPGRPSLAHRAASCRPADRVGGGWRLSGGYVSRSSVRSDHPRSRTRRPTIFVLGWRHRMRQSCR
jgi:CheY-like chemotaxis protein